MNLTSLYSIIILPSDKVIKIIEKFKIKLYEKSGRKYSGYKSIAHITVREFEATDHQLRKIILKLIKIASEQESFNAVFDQVVCSQKSLSAFALPDEKSNENFKKILERIRTEINGRCENGAHVSIGRKLSDEQLEISKEILSNVKFNFLCNRIALRKFNDNKKQFEVVKIFPFLEKPLSEEQLVFDF